MNKLLEDISVVDFTSRLPGPMSSMILADMGANVLKIEDSNRGDAFKESGLDSFEQWYKNLNQSKKIIELDFKNDLKKLLTLINSANIILITPFLSSILSKELSNIKGPIVILEIQGGHDEWKHLHDLNALGMCKSFNNHLLDSTNPPYLPFAGISFAQYISTLSLALLRKAESNQTLISEKVFLQDVIPQIFDTFDFGSNLKTRSLHNGLFPCYQVYRLKDGEHLCLAAVEEKFWNELVSSFNFTLTPSDRFDDSGRVQAYLKAKFLKLDSADIQATTKGKSLCMNIVKN